MPAQAGGAERYLSAGASGRQTALPPAAQVRVVERSGLRELFLQRQQQVLGQHGHAVLGRGGSSIFS